MKTNIYSTNNFTSNKYHRIIVDNKLIRGQAVTNPFTIRKLKKDNVTQIIDLRNTSYIRRPIERFFCKLFGIKYVNFKYPFRLNKLPDGKFFEQINYAITSNTGKTYMHCTYGKRRTGICTAIYEIAHSDKSHNQILNELVEHGFMETKSIYTSNRIKKLHAIYDDFIKKYLPEMQNLY